MYQACNPFGHYGDNNSKSDRIYQCSDENKSQGGSTIMQRVHQIFFKLLQSKQDKPGRPVKMGECSQFSCK
jgi:hypothetical protein